LSNDCIDAEHIPKVLELPVGDSKRRHVETCPRCSAFLASYKAFMKEEIVAGADPNDAHARITAFLESEIGAPRETMEKAARAKDPDRNGIFSSLTRVFYLRPAWVAALLVIVAAGVLWWRPWTSDRIVLRGPTPDGVVQPPTLSSPQLLSGGGIRLEWTPMAGADSYQVLLYDIDFDAIARLEPTTETTFVINRAMLPGDTPSTLIWRVVAIQRGDEIGASDPASFELQ
jgi:hypothetical protein